MDGGILLFLLFIMIVLIVSGIYKVEEGYVGVVYNLGKLQQELTQPGFHFSMPYNRIEQVQVSIQTDVIEDIPCGTSGGVLINFKSIEVVNKLNQNAVYETVKKYGIYYDKIWIHDKVHHEINQFCSKNSLEDIYINKFEYLDEELSTLLTEQLVKWVPGLEIISIRITKPTVPNQIKVNFEEQEKLRTQAAHINQQKNVKLEELKTSLNEKVTKAKSELEVKKIQMDRLIQQKESELELVKIQNEMYLNSKKLEVDGVFYQEEKELELVEQKLSEQYLESIMADALTNNVELYLGDKIPAYINPINRGEL